MQTKLPFLYGEDGTIMNGHWDVTETKEFLGAFVQGQEEVRLKDYLVYRPTQGYTCFERQMIRKVTRCKALYKAHEGHERRYLYRAEYYNPMFCFG
jgi:hypothetical protein